MLLLRLNNGDVIVGNYSPPFGFEKDQDEIRKIIGMVNTSNATVLAVGVGSPKQELFITRHSGDFAHITNFIAIGATIDFESGLVKRAPSFFTKIGLEWFYRFLSEPRRLFRRYFICGPSVIFKMLLFKFNKQSA